MNAILGLSAVEQSALLRRGELSSMELTRLYLQRIERLDSALSSFVHVSPRRALLAAALWDRARRRGRAPTSLLSGVPIGIKDLNLVRGMPARFGSRAFRWLIAPVHDETVRLLLAAGVIVLGKLTTSELGAMPVTEPDIHAPTRNPWDRTRTAGGSSGGSGAAVAASLVPIAQGSDGGGSIRIPAAFNHLFGFKASRGLMARSKVGDKLALVVQGALARTVDDSAAMHDLLTSGGSDATSAIAPPPGLRIGLSLDTIVSTTDPEIAAAVRRLAAVLGDLGHHVEESPWVNIAPEEFLMLWSRTVADVPVLRESVLQPVTRWLRASGRLLSADQVQRQKTMLAGRIDDWFAGSSGFDLRLSPTVPCAPPLIDGWRAERPEDSFARIVPIGSFTAVFNVSGQPAMAIPLGISSKGLPMSAQLAAPRGQDALLFGLGRQLEAALGGFRKRPGGY